MYAEVAPILARHVPDLKYAAARLARGSDVLGFDDPRSTDHYCGPMLELFMSPSPTGASAFRQLPDLESLSDYDARLRQIPRDAPALAAAARLASRLLRQARAVNDRQAEYRLHSYLGTACRILGRSRPARAHLRAAYSLASSPAAEVATLIRLGEVDRCRDAFVSAEKTLREALAKCRAGPALASYEDFALQHLGKCLLDAGAHAEAVACLQSALELRLARGDPALIASTRAALDLARRQS